MIFNLNIQIKINLYTVKTLKHNIDNRMVKFRDIDVLLADCVVTALYKRMVCLFQGLPLIALAAWFFLPVYISAKVK